MSRISGNSASDGLQTLLQLGVAHELVAGLDGGGLALDVGEDGGDLRDVAANLRLQHGHAVVGLLQAQVLVEFEMLLDVQLAL